MKIITLLICLGLLSCNFISNNQQYTGPAIGRIAGIVYWEYKPAFGSSPPDAGAAVYLFKTDSQKEALHINCNNKGIFIFDALQDGRYLVLVKSRHVKCNAIYYFNTLDVPLCREFLSLQLKDLSPAEYDSLKHFDSVYAVYQANEIRQSVTAIGYPDFKKKEAFADSIRNNLAYNLIRLIPNTKRLSPLLTDTGNPFKIHAFEATVMHGKCAPIVLDFSEGANPL